MWYNTHSHTTIMYYIVDILLGTFTMLKVCNSMLSLKDIGLVYQHQKDVSIDIER